MKSVVISHLCAAFFLFVQSCVLAGSGQAAPVSRTGTGEAAVADTSIALHRAPGVGRRIVAKHFRQHRKWPQSMIAERVSFLDENGHEIKEFISSLNLRLFVDADQKHVGVLENTGEDGPGVAYVFHYYDVRGRELWRQPLCCYLQKPEYLRVRLSRDGRLIGLIDSGEGDKCVCWGAEGGSYDCSAPPGCIGLRVMSEQGRIIAAFPHASAFRMSPNGRYVVMRYGKSEISLVDTSNGRLTKVPAHGGSPQMSVEDDGVVNYYDDERDPDPAERLFRYVPGLGIRPVPGERKK